VSDAGWKFIGLLCEKNHVCPSGSLRVKYKNKEKGKKESDRDGEIENEKGEGERERVCEREEQNERSTLVSIFSSKNNRNECIWYGTEHEIRILHYTI